jgi:hypothetical protein
MVTPCPGHCSQSQAHHGLRKYRLLGKESNGMSERTHRQQGQAQCCA